MRKKENVEGSAGGALSAAGLKHVVQEAGDISRVGDPLQTSELTVCFADEHEAKFGFIGQDELLAVARAISRCIL